MEHSITETIRNRRSVRTYSGEPLREEDRKKLEEYVKTIKNPFGVSIEFRFLDAKQYGLTSPVVVGADTYVAAKSERVPNLEIAFGYDFEQLVLYAQSIGIGTVWMAATFNRAVFEKAIELKDTEVMPAVTPIGYAAKKMSFKESLMRKGVKADARLPFETLFFKGTFSNPLMQSEAGRFGDALEMVRLAPSAVNKQPWRVVVCGNMVHFYEKKAKNMSKKDFVDIQKVDVGIALLHFELIMKEKNTEGGFVVNDPNLEKEADVEYIISYVVE